MQYFCTPPHQKRKKQNFNLIKLLDLFQEIQDQWNTLNITRDAISKIPAQDAGNTTGQTVALTSKSLWKNRQWGGEAQKTYQSKGLEDC